MENAGVRRPPYGPVGPVVALLQRYRRTNLPDAVDKALLRSLGIGRSNESKVVNVLAYLGYVDPEGRPTGAFRDLQATTDEEFRRHLALRVRAAYAHVFDAVDLEGAGYEAVYRHFGRRHSVSLGDNMARTFVGLCREAGIPAPEPAKAAGAAGPARSERAPRAGEARQPLAATAPAGGAPTDDELRRLYLQRLIEGLGAWTVSPGMDAAAIREVRAARAADLERIERLLGLGRGRASG